MFTWFVYVGACFAAPEATCRPFLAFVLLGAAACAALTLVLLAYRSARARDAVLIAEPRARAGSQERVRRAIAASGPSAGLPIHHQYRPVN
jgi:Flp pilus assembly protein protease CpaA